MKYLLGLGSNLGDRNENIHKAIEYLSEFGKIKKISSIEETEPWGNKDQKKFLNCVLLMESSSDPFELLKKLQKIEAKLGRRREIHWGPRTIDIDILWADNLIINENNLIIPHPYLHKRDFVLREINEIAPGFIHPVFKKKFKDIITTNSPN